MWSAILVCRSFNSRALVSYSFCVIHRTRGHSHGPIMRLVSPSGVGQLIRPFVFLDYFDIDSKRSPAIGFHPHSGIATLTLKNAHARERQLLPVSVHFQRGGGTRAKCRGQKLAGSGPPHQNRPLFSDGFIFGGVSAPFNPWPFIFVTHPRYNPTLH
jgi:hypothetical protein